jgi:hypothetical protein
MPEHHGGCMPSREQELLLRAALLKGDAALQAWRDWRARADPDRLDLGSFRLLPLLYRNLRGHGPQDPLIEKFKGIYRLTWYKNHLLFHRMAPLLRLFQNEGIETMLLKGAALILFYYKDYGARPMDDFDILVHPEQVPAAINLLKGLGWKIPFGGQKRLYENNMTNVIAFQHPSNGKLDLHWHVLWECCGGEADQDFWNGAVSINFGDIPTSVLNPADQLLHVCVHGARWNPLPPLRWIADAMFVIGCEDAAINWDRVVDQAIARRLTLVQRNTSHYLSNLLDAPVPSTFLEKMNEAPTSWMEHLEYSATTRDHPWLGALPLTCFMYARLMRQAPGQHKLIGFPKYLQFTWDVEHLWQMLPSMAARTSKRVLRSIKRRYAT